MATMASQGTQPVSGGDIEAAPITDTDNNIINTYNGNNADENNVDYSSTDGVGVMRQAQTFTGLKTLENTSAAAGGVRTGLVVSHNPASGTPGDNDGIEVLFKGDDDGGNVTTFGEIECVFTDVSDGSEDGSLVFKVPVNGTMTTAMTLTGTTVTFPGSFELGDDDQLKFGAGTDYWLVYDATNTAFELNSTNISGGTDGVIFDVQDGTNDTRFYGGLSLDGQTAPTAGLVLNGDIDMTTNGNRIDLDTDNDTSIRASADDTIMIEVAGADDFSITANSFNVLSGSIIDLADNATVTFGDGDDATIKWDASNLAVSAGTAAVNITAGDMTLYDDNNNADVSLTMGTSATESLSIQVLNGGSNKTAEEVKFVTATASGTGDHGKITFNVDGSDIVSIDDGGLSLNGALAIDTGGNNALTLNAGTADVIITASDLDVNGNADIAGTLTIGVDDTGYDVQMFGAAAGAYLLWDEDANTLDIRGATAAGPGAISLETGELTVADGDILGRIDFSAPVESDGTDAILVGASIWAEADVAFDGSNNATSLVFGAATSETAAAVMRLSKTALTPQTTDGLSLGTSALNFSDLFLDSGAVINFDSGDVTVTHAAGKLTFGGDGAVELDFNNHEMTNVDINSGAIDGTIIGAASAAAGSFAAIVGTSLDLNGAADISGNLGLGTASPASQDSTQGIEISGTGFPFLQFTKTNAGTGNTLGTIGFSRTNSDALAKIGATTDGATDSAYIFFQTQPASGAITERMRINSGGQVFIGDTANANVTQGLTINQGANDDAIIALKSSDIAHGLTGQGETDTFLNIQKGNATIGGVTYQAIAEDGATSIVVTHDTWGGTADTTKSSSGNGLMTYNFREHNGSNAVANMAANSNLVAIKGYIGSSLVTKFIFDVDGDSHQDVGTAWTNFDDEHDALVTRSLGLVMDKASAIKTKWDDWGRDHQADLERTGIIPVLTQEQIDNGEHALVNTTQVMRLHNGALWQLYTQIMDMCETLENNVPSLKGKLLPQGA